MRTILFTLLVWLSCTTAALATSPQRPMSEDFKKGVQALQEGRPEEAYRCLTSELTVHPDNGYAHCYMAFVCNFYENPKLALQAIDLALTYLPESDKEYRSLAYYTRGMIFLNHKEWILAESDFNDAILANPNDAENYLCRAQVYFHTDRWEDAMDDMHHALALDKTISVNEILQQFNGMNAVAAQ